MLKVTPIKAFSDNYIWAITAPGSSVAVVVDPGESAQVLSWLEEQQLELAAILITHKHSDHTAGVMELSFAFPNVVVYGPANEPIRGIKKRLSEGDTVQIDGLPLTLNVMELPGHTEGHIAYYGDGGIFCGDVLFGGGCGRLFGGTAEQMHHSLSRIRDLPGDTAVYCAHEYTLDNLGFGKWVEPENGELDRRIEATKQLLAQDEQSVPFSISLELETNPFLRLNTPSVKRAAEKYVGKTLEEGTEVFAAVRNWKDKEYD